MCHALDEVHHNHSPFCFVLCPLSPWAWAYIYWFWFSVHFCDLLWWVQDERFESVWICCYSWIFFAFMFFLSRELLPTRQIHLFDPWVYRFGHELIQLSSQLPLVSGFYKLLTICMTMSRKTVFFKVSLRVMKEIMIWYSFAYNYYYVIL